MPTNPTAAEVRVAAELRMADDVNRRIEGYAAVFNSLSEDLGGFREVIRPGAFAASLAGADVRALVNHDPTLLLGRSKAGTLTLAEDSRGLRVAIDLPDTQLGRDIAVSVGRGDLSQMSFRFYMPEDGTGQTWRSEPTGVIREISTIRAIDDVSLVTYPAYPQTEAALRDLARAQAAAVDPGPTRGRRLFVMRSRLRLAEAG